MAASFPPDVASASNVRLVRRISCTVAALSCVLAFHSSVQAAWQAREPGGMAQSLRPEDLKRADALYARLVPRAVVATRPRGEVAPQSSKSGTNDGVTPAPVTATAAAPGQAGYVHYFLIRRPDGIAEMQVGMELPDQSIAWSFPSVGVSVSPFIESGTVAGRDGQYEVTHLFGIRPFPDGLAMAKLATALPVRVMPWVEDNVQHCDLDPPHREACVSCLGFVLRVLFPGPFPSYPSLPADFRQARAGERYTTEDLLIYLTGLHKLETRAARVARIHALDMPQNLRDELLRVVSSDDVTTEPAAAPQERGRAQRTIVKSPAPRATRPPRRL